MEINQLLPLINSLRDPILLLDKDGRIVAFNQATLSLAEGKPRKLAGKHVLEAINLYQAPASDKDWRAALESLKGESAVRFLNEELIVDLTILQFQDNALLILKDYSLEKKLHESFKGKIAELEYLNENLEKQVSERTEELTFQNHLLERIYNAIDETVILSDLTGRCLPHQPEKSAEFFGLKSLGQLQVGELLLRDKDKQDEFNLWLSIVQTDSLPFEDLENLMSQEVKIGERFVEMRIKILQQSTKTILFILKDKTEMKQLKIKMKEIGEDNRLLTAIIKEPVRLKDKFEEWEELCRKIETLLEKEDHEKASFALHLLKGSLQLESFYEAYLEVHEIELLGKNSTLNDIIRLKNILKQKKMLLNKSADAHPSVESIKTLIEGTIRILRKESDNFQYHICGDASVTNSQKKSIELITLQHFRNLLAHAFTSPEDREKEGKTPQNNLSILIQETQEALSIRFSDDGRGTKSFLKKKGNRPYERHGSRHRCDEGRSK
jgi:hypothetical protein